MTVYTSVILNRYSLNLISFKMIDKPFTLHILEERVPLPLDSHKIFLQSIEYVLLCWVSLLFGGWNICSEWNTMKMYYINDIIQNTLFIWRMHSVFLPTRKTGAVLPFYTCLCQFLTPTWRKSLGEGFLEKPRE